MKNHLNVKLKMAILESGRKQQRIADLAHMDRTKLSHIVRGRRPPSAEERAKLADVLACDEATLFPHV